MIKKSVGIPILITIIALILIIFIGAPAITGGIVKRKIEGWQRQINLPNAQMTITVSNYHRGWFHSTADLKIITTESANIASQLFQDADKIKKTEPSPLKLMMKLNITHGPFVHIAHIVAGNEWAWNGGMAKAEIKMLPPAPDTDNNFPILKQAIVANLLLKWNGMIVAWITQGHGTMYQDTDTDSRVSAQNITSKLIVSHNFAQLNGYTQIKGLQITVDDNNQIKINNLVHDINLKLGADNIWYGQSVLTMPLVRFTVMSHELARLNHVVLTSNDKRTTDNTLTVRDRASIDSILLSGKKFGSFNFDFSIEKLNPKTLLEFRQLYQKIQQYLNSLSSTKALDQNKKETLMNEIQPIVLKFLQGVEFKLNDFQFKTEMGQARLTGHVTLSTLKSIHPNQEPTWKTLLDLMIHSQGGAKFIISQQLFDQMIELLQLLPNVNQRLSNLVNGNPPVSRPSISTENTDIFSQLSNIINSQQQNRLMQNLINKGWLKKEKGNYVIDLNYDKKILTINGNPLDQIISSYNPSKKSYHQPYHNHGNTDT